MRGANLILWAGLPYTKSSGLGENACLAQILEPRRAGGFDRLPKQTFGGLRRGQATPVRRPDARALRYVARTLAIRSAGKVAQELGIFRSWAYELRAHCRQTDAPPEPLPVGRPRREITRAQGYGVC